METITILLILNLFLLALLISGVAFIGYQYYEDRKEVQKKNEEFEQEIIKPIEENTITWKENQDPEALDSFMSGDLSSIDKLDMEGLMAIGAGDNGFGTMLKSGGLFRQVFSGMLRESTLKPLADYLGVPPSVVKPIAVTFLSSFAGIAQRSLTNRLMARVLDDDNGAVTKKQTKKVRAAPYAKPGEINF